MDWINMDFGAPM